MFKIESYVTPILLSYVDKYVKDFKPADAQVSLWGGGVALHNLVLKADVLQQEVALPFTLVSGRIHELLIQVPWTKIMSEPIVVTIDTIECVLSLTRPATSDSSQPPEPSRANTQVLEAPPGYMQALVRRIVSNIALRVHHLIVKYVQDDVVMSLNVKHVAVDSAGAQWEPAFADIDPSYPVIRRLVRLDDLTLCLDRADADGKIRYYQEPLLYRCQLNFRVSTKLVSANTRRASSMAVHLRSTKLAFGVTNDQLVLLIRLLRERNTVEVKTPPPPPPPRMAPTMLEDDSASDSAEPVRKESWSEWAWSWLPAWSDREGGLEEVPLPAAPIPIYFTGYLDDVSLSYKIMEMESSSRKRARSILELSVMHGAIMCKICSPTTMRVRLGLRLVSVSSHGKCICGHDNINSINKAPTLYLKTVEADEQQEWSWPDEVAVEPTVETAEVADEDMQATEPPRSATQQSPSRIHLEQDVDTSPGQADQLIPSASVEKLDDFWRKMAPVLYIEYLHERSPPDRRENPYENPPKDFEYSDWVEICNVNVKLEPIELRVSMGLLHRLDALKNVFDELPPPPPQELAMRTLTVEEIESLVDNLPQRKIIIEMRNVNCRIHPLDHRQHDRPQPASIVLDIDMPNALIVANGPLYPHRVCSAACQLPKDNVQLLNAARLHVSVTVPSLQFRIVSPRNPQPRQCARTDFRLVVHILLNKEYFNIREFVEFSYSMKIRETNVSGSAARLQAAYHVPVSLMKNHICAPMRCSSLPADAIHDEEAVAVDMTIEDVSIRGYVTRNINTHILSVQSARTTAFHAPQNEDTMKQAWIFSAPETPSTTPYIRIAIQWCSKPVPNSFDYLGVWTEPAVFSVDPLLIAFLAYKPQVHAKSSYFLGTAASSKSSQFFHRRRVTPPSSSGRSSSRGAELVHVRPRSLGSSSEPSDKKELEPSTQPKPPTSPLSNERLVALYERLRFMLLNVELGLLLVYVPCTTVSAVDCETVRDAMERHAAFESVLALGLGRLSMHSSSIMKHLWQDIRHDGPTFSEKGPTDAEESFPWKLRLADMSCYTLETAPIISEKEGMDRSASSLRSKIKIVGVHPRTMLELITTTVTLSVVTRSLQIKMPVKQDPEKQQAKQHDEERLKYFTTGVDFKPTTLKEFLRGPAKRKKVVLPQEEKSSGHIETYTMVGPVVLLGVNLHADTPPVMFRIGQDQVHVISSAIHCFQHIVTLLNRPPVVVPKHHHGSQRAFVRSNKTSPVPGSFAEMDEQQDTPSESSTSENQSDLISIYEPKSDSLVKLNKFCWFQWVISHATVVVATPQMKIVFEIDDLISTVDIQEHYDQFKLKLASASVRHYERRDNDWAPGVLGGRMLEAREPTNPKEENHFLSITITQAQISNLPARWRDELHPKMLERRTSTDTMWEVYATLAPLEAVLQPTTLEHIVFLAKQLSTKSFCPIAVERDHRSSANIQWPFVFVTAGGIRLLITGEEEDPKNDDTFIFSVGKVSVTPHPDNPIYRRPVNCSDPIWASSNMAYEGRQYELNVMNVAVKSAQFRSIIEDESCETIKGQDNPAVKWARPKKQTSVTPVLHAVDLGMVFAPAHFVGGVLACGPATEINFVSDCAIELSIEQLVLIQQILDDMQRSLSDVGSPTSMMMRDEKFGICPYAQLLQEYPDESPSISSLQFVDDSTKLDSGIDTGASQQSTQKSCKNIEEIPSLSFKKTLSVNFVENSWADASDYLEVFVTMGVIELSLYVGDDDSPEVVALRAPSDFEPGSNAVPGPCSLKNKRLSTPERPIQTKPRPKSQRSEELSRSASGQSITDNIREDDIAYIKIDIANLPKARRCEGNLPLIHATLYQPNLYYWRKKNQHSLQVSLFNAWVGLGAGDVEGFWHLPLVSTAKGVPDPATDIPPALATIKMVAPYGLSSMTSGPGSSRGTIRLDVERPVKLEVCLDRIRRINDMLKLIEDRIPSGASNVDQSSNDHIFYKIRRLMVKNVLESVTIQTSQICVTSASGTCGCDSTSMQIAYGVRPERVVIRALLTSLLVASGQEGERRHVILQPLLMGLSLEATWEAWRRVESCLESRIPTIRAGLHLDNVIIDLRPTDVLVLDEATNLVEFMKPKTSDKRCSGQTLYQCKDSTMKLARSSSITFGDLDLTDHFYKDDLRSGAFKMVGGGQLPMAYQVMVHGHAVSWRYPHPRAITRIVAFPIPGLDEEVDCVLELHSPIQNRWMTHTYFKLPVSEPREIKLYVSPPDTVFALMWRFRACDEDTEKMERPFEFNVFHFLPKEDPLVTDTFAEIHTIPPVPESGVTAEQLCGVLRVDSYFAPRLLPRTRVAFKMSCFEVNLHNSLPNVPSRKSVLEGYYVSRPLMRSHRVLTVLARNFAVNVHGNSAAGTLVLFDTNLSMDILESATGALEQMVKEFTVRGAVSLPRATGLAVQPRVRCRTRSVHIALHVPRVRTLHALATDWKNVLKKTGELPVDKIDATMENFVTEDDLAKAAAVALEGRVALWIHNSCGSALRVGQEGTEEAVHMSPGASLAYRWRSPTASRKLKFSVIGPVTEWKWSNGIPFHVGLTRVRLEENATKMKPGGGLYMYVKIVESGATRSMHLMGRLGFANLLRHKLLYKVRGRCNVSNQWSHVCSGDLPAESVDHTVICGADCDMVLKIKFEAQDTGWSGDIPLKECPKENVPWLVKVPSVGEVQYTSVWCRVSRARSDGRVLATVWPLYVLHSHLPLDTVVMITTNRTSVSDTDLISDDTPPPLVQTAMGRGTCTHLVAPGTTAARHSLTFQYKNIDCPVTREAVPMHYGVTDSSVFEKRTPVSDIEDIVKEVHQWLERSSRNATSDWPYSLVTKHWPMPWKPAFLQPRCDVTVRYQAVNAGGGCSLEIQLCPVVLLCNASPMALTLRAHDAAPLCKLEPGYAISLPSAVLKKPFFLSVEMDRQTFVSEQLELFHEEPGRYGVPPAGMLAVGHSTSFAILCSHKVALLTMYYEIKQDINVLGVSSTYVILNRLNRDILVSAVAVPVEMEMRSGTILRSTTYKIVPPTKADSIHGTSIARFWMRSHWRGHSASELQHYLCLALPSSDGTSTLTPQGHEAVPILLGTQKKARRAVALTDVNNKSVSVVVTQMKQDGRYLISVAYDPCPQFVVHNLTKTALLIAEPVVASDEPSTSVTTPQQECEGTGWWCAVPAESMKHYSTPTHCARYPPPAVPRMPELPLLTFARVSEVKPKWCPAVMAADGEQMLQLHNNVTLKMRVRTYPHSTLIELQNVDQNDISASDIRKRLQGTLDSESSEQFISTEYSLDRVEAKEKLLRRNTTSETERQARVSRDKDVMPPPPPPPGRKSVSLSLIEPNFKLKALDSSGDLGIIKAVTRSNLQVEQSLSAEDLYADHSNSKPMRLSVDADEEEADLTQRTAKGSSDSFTFHDILFPDFNEGETLPPRERARIVFDAIVVELAATSDVNPLLALHADRLAVLVVSHRLSTKTTFTISDIQIDNLQYDTGQFDFGVIASTRNERRPVDRWPPIWNLFVNREAFESRKEEARLLLVMQHDTWAVAECTFNELTEVEVSLGPLALYVEDAYVSALVNLWRLAVPSAPLSDAASTLSHELALQHPLRLRLLHLRPLDLTLTLHTAVRMYIALDQSPLRLSAFKLHDMMTSPERLTHALTVHYLSAAILGAGWVVGGLELLGAPGALAARLGEASGGVRGIVSATAAALLRSLSAWAGSLARNLDLLAGDEEHARRAAAARRRPPQSLMGGLATGITNFAINILGAVGGLAHHPLVGVAVGETESGAAALRRGLVGALTKPLSATADLVAYAGHGLLSQTGWSPIPQPRIGNGERELRVQAAWRRDCVRWSFRLSELTALGGYEVMVDNSPLQLLLTHKYLVVADPDSEKILEMIDLRACSLGPYQGTVIEMTVSQLQRRATKVETRIPEEDDEYQISAAAMARVARYTGAESSDAAAPESRVLAFMCTPMRAHALYAALAAAIHHNSDTHFSLL